MSEELRYTATHESDETKGGLFKLEGDLFIPVVISIAASISLAIVLFALFHVHVVVSCLFGTVPAIITFIYVFTLKQGKPSGYSNDFFDGLISGKGFEQNPHSRQENPYA